MVDTPHNQQAAGSDGLGGLINDLSFDYVLFWFGAR
jgi:hypothetical protein